LLLKRDFFFLACKEYGRATTEALPGVRKVRRANEEVPDMQKLFWNQMVRPTQVSFVTLCVNCGFVPITHFSVAGTTAANRARQLTGRCTSGAMMSSNQTKVMKTVFTKVRRETETE
jgi:hypothetical protein